MIDYLALPKETQLHKRLYKNQFDDHPHLSKLEKRLLIEEIDTIYWENTIKPSTIAIASFLTEEVDFSEVEVFIVNLKTQNKREAIHTVLQKAIPYPLFILFQHQEYCSFSLVQKRINQNDSDRVVIEGEYNTPWIETNRLTSKEESFTQDLSIQNHPYSTFDKLFEYWKKAIVGYNLSLKMDSERNTLQTQNQELLLNEINILELSIKTLKTALKKEKQLNRKVELNVKIKKAENELKCLKGTPR
jgi:hypothetical protein